MKIIINGALGKMGVELTRIINESDGKFELAAGVDARADGTNGTYSKLSEFNGEADIIIDFSVNKSFKLVNY